MNVTNTENNPTYNTPYNRPDANASASNKQSRTCRKSVAEYVTTSRTSEPA